MSVNEHVLARIEELKTAVAECGIQASARKRSWRVAVLQGLIDGGLALIEARKVMYADQMAEGRTLVAVDEAAETAAIAEGFSERAGRISETFPKTLYHPGYPTGGATGMMVKDFRGKDANQEIWKYDAVLAGKIAEHLKQVAIEEGQWSEKRDLSGAVPLAAAKAMLNAGRDRLAAEKKAALAKGFSWPPPSNAR